MNLSTSCRKARSLLISIFLGLSIPAVATETQRVFESDALDAPARSQFKVVAASAQHVQMLQNGGFVLYMRHGPSDARFPDQLPLQLDKCESQRPLSTQGREVLKRIGRDLSKLKLSFEEIISSPFCRVQESVNLVFGVKPTVDPKLRYTAAMPDVQKQPAVARTRYWISLHVQDPRKNRVVVAHGPNIAELMDYLPPEGGMIVFRPKGDAGFEYVASIEPQHWSALLRELGHP